MLSFLVLLGSGYSQEDSFDVDFIAGRLDGVKILLFYKGKGLLTTNNDNDNWLGINVEKPSIQGYDCTQNGGNYNNKRSHHETCTFQKQPTSENTAKKLEIVKTSSKNIPRNIFRKYFSLQNFSMCNQGVPEISQGDFGGASELQNLDLSLNKITALDDDVFSSVLQLKSLDLSGNEISAISPSAFNELTQIGTIHLNDNRLTVMYLPWLRPSIQTMILSNNLISQLSGNLPSPARMEEIHLDNNSLRDISSLDSLTVRSIGISRNPLKDDHDSIKIDALRIDISNANVKVCFVSPTTESMNAENNKISEISVPEEANGRPFKLNSLQLANNLLKSIATLSHFSELITLDLSHNSIESVDVSIFAAMPSLNWLSLSHNQIHRIDYQTATNPMSVEYMNVAYNKLEQFKLNAAFVNLNELHIEGNRLRDIDTKMKLMAPNLVKIGLNDNQWSCSYLSTSVMLLRLEGILPVFLENTTSLLTTLNKYDDDVLGIGCLNSQVGREGKVSSITPKPDFNEDAIEQVVNANLNSRMKELETKLLDSFNFKFNQIFDLLNQTAKHD